MYLNGHGIPGLDARGGRIVDDHFLLYFNASADDVPLTLPPEEYAAAWDVEIDTAGTERADEPLAAGSTAVLAGRSVLVLREHTAAVVTQDSSVAASVAASQASRADRTG
jgi:glycogen operon protein